MCLNVVLLQSGQFCCRTLYVQEVMPQFIIAVKLKYGHYFLISSTIILCVQEVVTQFIIAIKLKYGHYFLDIQ